jgi:carboxymethylenebutenolidase
MTVRWENVNVAGKSMRTYIAMPDAPGPHPAVIIGQHVWGIDEPIQDVVHRLHREGYAVAAPELFHRQPAGIEQLKRIPLLDDGETVDDMNACIAHLKALNPALGRVGVAGFCMGGRVSYLMATANPALSAAVVLYGGAIMSPLGPHPTPFARSADINCPVLGLFGEKDANPSPEDTAKISAELTRLNKWHEFHTYRDAGHAFMNFSSADRYRHRPAQAAWGEMMAFLEMHLRRA